MILKDTNFVFMALEQIWLCILILDFILNLMIIRLVKLFILQSGVISNFKKPKTKITHLYSPDPNRNHLGDPL